MRGFGTKIFGKNANKEKYNENSQGALLFYLYSSVSATFSETNSTSAT